MATGWADRKASLSETDSSKYPIMATARLQYAIAVDYADVDPI